jgi:hypothetical protein
LSSNNNGKNLFYIIMRNSESISCQTAANLINCNSLDETCAFDKDNLYKTFLKNKNYGK